MVKQKEYIELSYKLIDFPLTIKFCKNDLIEHYNVFIFIQRNKGEPSISIREYIKIRFFEAAISYIETGRDVGFFIH